MYAAGTLTRSEADRLKAVLQPMLAATLEACGMGIEAELEGIRDRLKRFEEKDKYAATEQFTGDALLVRSEVASAPEAASSNERRGEIKT